MISIAFKHQDCVYVASCSHNWTSHSTSYVETNMPLWAPATCSNSLISYDGEYRPLNVLRFYKPLMSNQTLGNNKLTTNYVVRHILKTAIANLQEGKLISEDECSDSIFGNMLIANNDSLFKLDSYGYVREISDYIAIGIGYERAMAGLEAYNDVNDPILRALKVMCDCLGQSGVGDFPILIRNTKEPNKCWAYDMDAAIAYIHKHAKGGQVK